MVIIIIALFFIELILFGLSSLLGEGWRGIVFLPFILIFIIQMIVLSKDPQIIKDFYNDCPLNYGSWIESETALWIGTIIGLVVFTLLFFRTLI